MRTCVQCVVLWLATILQLIGLFTPGWRIVSSITGYSSSYGLWFYRECDSDGECENTSYFDYHKESMSINPTSQQAMTYASQVGDQVTGLLALLIYFTASCLCCCDDVQKRSVAISSLLLVGGTMVWTLVGYKLVILAAELRSLEEDSQYSIGFPYSMFLSAIGALLMTCSTGANLCLICDE